MGMAQERDVLNKIEKYIHIAVRSSERKYGRLPGCFCSGLCQDVVQLVHENLLQRNSLGSGYLQKIGNMINAEPSIFKASLEYKKLAEAIKQAIGQARWKLDKRRQRGKQEVPLPEDYEGMQFSESVLIDMTTDLLRLFHRWTSLEQRVWQGRFSGKTIRQLGEELDMDFRRVNEISNRLLEEIHAYLEKDL